MSIDAGSRNTGWLYDLSREIWKGYTATRFYRSIAARASIYVCGHLFMYAGIYIEVHMHLFISAYASVYRCGCHIFAIATSSS